MTEDGLTPVETALVPSGRDARGRFAPGNPGGPGRPPRQTELEYLLATQSACTVQEWGMIVHRAKEDALGGCAMARAFLARYLIGPAPPPWTEVEPDRLPGLTPEFLREMGENMVAQQQAEALLRHPHGPEWREWLGAEYERLGLDDYCNRSEPRVGAELPHSGQVAAPLSG